MIEFGIINYLIKKEISKSGSCPTSVNFKVKGNQIRSLVLKDFYGVFMIYVGGLYTLLEIFIDFNIIILSRTVKCINNAISYK